MKDGLKIMSNESASTDEKIAKLRWQLSVVVESLPFDNLARFIIKYNLSQEKLNAIHDVFEAYDKSLKAKGALAKNIDWDVFWKAFEKELLNKFFQKNDLTAYEIVYALLNSGRWVDVIRKYLEWKKE